MDSFDFVCGPTKDRILLEKRKKFISEHKSMVLDDFLALIVSKTDEFLEK